MSTQPRKKRGHGRTQKAIAVRIDLDLLPYLEAQSNKAMAINKAIRAAKEAYDRRQQVLPLGDKTKDCTNCRHANTHTPDGSVWCTHYLRALPTAQVYCPAYTTT